MHSVSKLEDIPAQTPEGYRANSAGFHRLAYVNRAIGSVHMGTVRRKHASVDLKSIRKMAYKPLITSCPNPLSNFQCSS
jgi:hypothetical protein